MSTAPVLLLVATSLYAGFQVTIRALVYPQFAGVPTQAFAAYERQHTRRVSFVVGPLFALFAATLVAAFASRPDVWCVAVAICFVGILALTAWGAVPQHRRLSVAFEAAAHRRLLAVDSGRVALALLACVAAAAHLMS